MILLTTTFPLKFRISIEELMKTQPVMHSREVVLEDVEDKYKNFQVDSTLKSK